MDTGNYLQPPGPTSSLVNGLMMESLESLPMSAINLAPGDLFYWRDLSNSKAYRHYISTNLEPRDPDVKPPLKHLVVTLDQMILDSGEKLRIGFLGVSAPSRVRPNSGFTGSDPQEAVSRELELLRDEVDIVIVLADLPDQELNAIATRNPEVDAILRAESQYIRLPARIENNAVILSAVERARYLGELTLVLAPDGTVTEVHPDLVEMNAEVDEDPGWLGKQRALRNRLP